MRASRSHACSAGLITRSERLKACSAALHTCSEQLYECSACLHPRAARLRRPSAFPHACAATLNTCSARRLTCSAGLHACNAFLNACYFHRGALEQVHFARSSLDNALSTFTVRALYRLLSRNSPEMSVLFLKRFLSRPRQVASIVPSSRTLIRKVASKLDFSRPRTIAEYGPGEGCHTREMLQRMHPESRLLLFELDPELAGHLARTYRDEKRVSVLNADAASLPQALAERGLPHCDYIISGIPFSLIPPEAKRSLLRSTFDSLAPHDDAAFVIYQVTNELRDRGHCDHFPRAESEYCLVNIPPMFVTKFYKTANGHAKNGNGRH